MIRLSQRDTIESIHNDIKKFNGQPGFISPNGDFYEIRSNPHYGQYHGMWVADHWTELKQLGANLPDEDDFPFHFQKFPHDLLKGGSDSVRNLLVEDGWIQNFDAWEFCILSLSKNSSLLLDFLLTCGYPYQNDDEFEIIELAGMKRHTFTWADIKENGFQ